MYEKALDLAREERYEQARKVFSLVTRRSPHFCKAWVSWAQMEKRLGRLGLDPSGWDNCHQVLDAGLRVNPESACLAQAWGLMLLQRGNLWAAVKMLERSVQLDPVACAPVLKWRPVSIARSSMQACGGRRTCVVAGAAASGGAGGSATAGSMAGGATASASSAAGAKIASGPGGGNNASRRRGEAL